MRLLAYHLHSDTLLAYTPHCTLGAMKNDAHLFDWLGSAANISDVVGLNSRSSFEILTNLTFKMRAKVLIP